MSTRVLVPFYSTYGHTFQMARAVADGADDVDQTTVRLRRIPELPASRDALSDQDDYEETQAAMQD
jgi:NAD(P)H dehydrogenase (quinone)